MVVPSVHAGTLGGNLEQRRQWFGMEFRFNAAGGPSAMSFRFLIFQVAGAVVAMLFPAKNWIPYQGCVRLNSELGCIGRMWLQTINGSRKMAINMRKVAL